MNNRENDLEKPVIIIEEKPEIIPNQGEGERPVITVESDEPQVSSSKVKRRWPIALASFAAAVLLCLVALLGWRWYRTYINIGIPVSTTPEENIAILEKPDSLKVTPEVIKTSDSILGVALNFYEMRGLKAEIQMQEPDTCDQSVFLYSRCADYQKDFSIIGSMVINGQELHTVRNYRLGYFAAANGHFVIGIARSEKVKDYVIAHQGNFFRQFILLSAGVMPRQYYLHGKVERRGIGRMPDGRLYYIETLHKETMWDFADALREYGFVDAIYITGGYDYCYYRTADGGRHDIGDSSLYPHKNAGQIPWVVFRKK